MTASGTEGGKRWAVLVVEDDPFLLADAMDLATDAGLVAYGAKNADKAVALLERHPEIRILFTDIHMSGSMDGLALAHAVRRRWPPVAIMVTSGVKKVTKEDLPENGVFFAKPYPPKAIVKAMNEIAAKIAA